MAILVNLIVIIFLIYLWKRGKKDIQFRKSAPALMVSVGILGTFVGIFIALVPFDPSPDRIQASIEALISGMKTSFSTSIWGLAGSIICRTMWIPKNLSQEIKDSLSDSLNDLVRDIEQVMKESMERLVGEIQSTLDTKMGELIQSMTGKMDEKLGEFNESVGKLQEWQEANQASMETCTEAFNDATNQIREIKENCAHISGTMEQLRAVVALAQEQIDGLDGRLKTFSDMKEQTKETLQSLQGISTDLRNITDNLSGLKTVIDENHQKALRTTEKHSEEVGIIVKGIETETFNAVEAIKKDVSTMVAGIHAQLTGISTQWGENVLAIAKKCAEVIESDKSDKPNDQNRAD